MSHKKMIAVIFGGRSVEHDVSIITAQTIMFNLRKMDDKYNYLPIYITKEGRWLASKKFDKLSTFENFDGSRLTPIQVKLDGESKKFVVTVKEGMAKNEYAIDVAFPAMHGTTGEDGTLQGFLEMTRVPYVGCEVNASALCMNKVATKQVFASSDIPSVAWVSFDRAEFSSSEKDMIKKIESKLKYPVFVKPANLGSSIGITRALDQKTLLDAIEVAFFYDSKIIVEEGVCDLVEINCAVLGNDEPIPSVLEQPVPKADFLNFSEKYISEGGSMKGGKGMAKIPAPLSPKKTKEIQDMALKVFRSLGCVGTARVDFLVDKGDKEKVYVNEVNPLPGMLHMHLWKATGIEAEDLVCRLIELSLERQSQKEALVRTFDSSVIGVTKEYMKDLKGFN